MLSLHYLFCLPTLPYTLEVYHKILSITCLSRSTTMIAHVKPLNSWLSDDHPPKLLPLRPCYDGRLEQR